MAATSTKHKTYAASNIEEFERELTNATGTGLHRFTNNLSQMERQRCLEEGGLFYLGTTDEKSVYFPTLLSIGSLFTISTDKRSSAQVPVKIPLKVGGFAEGKLIRGKLDESNPEAYGQLDTFDLRVFMAAIKLWEKQGFPVIQDTKSQLLIGKLMASKNQVAREVFPNIKSPGDRHFKFIQNALMNLSSRPYCLTFRDNDGTKKGLGFKLLGEITLIKYQRKRVADQASIIVFFSTIVTEQFRRRRLLHRSFEALSEIKSEMAKLTFFYLEPKLISLKNRSTGDDLFYSRMLKDFIQDLGLPPAGWQKHASARYRLFKHVATSLSGKVCSKQDYCIKADIRKVEDDHKIVAWLEKLEQPDLKEPNVNPKLSN